MSVFFVDEYQRQLDDRGRMVLPAKVREKLSPVVYITKSVSDNCLHLYTEEEWEKLGEKISKLPTATDKNAAAFVRMFYGRATACEIDKQGRVPIAKRLMDAVGLERDVVLVGVNTRLEIWDSSAWEKYQDSLSDTIMLDGIKEYNLNI